MSDSSDEDFFHQTEVVPFRFVPSLSPEEVAARKRRRQAEEQDGSETSVAGPGRTEDKFWCTCNQCILMPTDTECVCCQEFRMAESEETTSSQTPGKCVNTEHPDFEPHLNEGVLDTYFRSHQYNWKKFPKPKGPHGSLTNAQLRLVAYRFCLDWLLKGERLGRKKRIPLPACIVNRIRTKYPADNNQYAGFQFADLPTV